MKMEEKIGSSFLRYSFLLIFIYLRSIEGTRDYGDECQTLTTNLVFQTRNPDDSKICDSAKGLYCIPHSLTCGCQVPGAIYRDGKCRGRVFQQCYGFPPGHEHQRLDCVKNAICGNSLLNPIYPGNNQLSQYQQGFMDKSGTGGQYNPQSINNWAADPRNYPSNYYGNKDYQRFGSNYRSDSSYYPSSSYNYHQSDYYNQRYSPDSIYRRFGGNGDYLADTRNYEPRNYENSNLCLCLPGYWSNVEGTVCNSQSRINPGSLLNYSLFYGLILATHKLYSIAF